MPCTKQGMGLLIYISMAYASNLILIIIIESWLDFVYILVID